MGLLEDSLRACIEAHLVMNKVRSTDLAKRADIPPTSLQRFLRKERSLKTPTIIALVEALGLQLVPVDPKVAANADQAIEERHRQQMRALAEKARMISQDIKDIGAELDSLASK